MLELVPELGEMAGSEARPSCFGGLVESVHKVADHRVDPRVEPEDGDDE